MSLRNALYRLLGRRGTESAAHPSADRRCPGESDILAYYEEKLSDRNRARIEKHFARCDDCRELIALFARESNEEGLSVTPPTESEVKAQTASVLSLIEQDELTAGSAPRRDVRAANPKSGFYLSYPTLAAIAMIVCAVAVAAVFLITKDPSPEDSARQALAQSMKDGRRTPARISGGLGHSDYSATRGEGDDDDLHLQRALDKLKFAEKETAPADARLALARVHLAFNRPENTRQALRILREVAASGHHSPELLNDIGVAQFDLGNYSEAISSFSLALGSSSNYGEALFNKALAEERAGRAGDAIRDWEAFISITPDGAWKTEARRRLGMLQKPVSLGQPRPRSNCLI
jgi:tetratricopeptide (TPR) repeat protein